MNEGTCSIATTVAASMGAHTIGGGIAAVALIWIALGILSLLAMASQHDHLDTFTDVAIIALGPIALAVMALRGLIPALLLMGRR